MHRVNDAGGFEHRYAFDPSYGHTLETLLAIEPPEEPADFASFWEARYERARAVVAGPRLHRTRGTYADFEVFDMSYLSTGRFPIGGWLVQPCAEPVRRGFVVGHGYGGREGPDPELLVPDAAYLFPCCRGISRSRRAPISPDPAWHVLHDIGQRDRYILGGCVEDVWVAVSVLLELFPQIGSRVGYLGSSFGGGVGALATAWDARIARAHWHVPSFGHFPLRLTLPTIGSGAAVRAYQRRHGNVMETLRYYDAAVAARRVRRPVHVGAALFDPAVAPPGQYAIYNALPGPKSLCVLPAGHFEYPAREADERRMREELKTFFADL